MTGLEEEQRQAVGVAIAQLERQPALERLAVARPGFGLDRMPPTRTDDQPIPSPEVGRARERYLGRESE